MTLEEMSINQNTMVEKIGFLGKKGLFQEDNDKIIEYNKKVDEFNNWLKSTTESVSVQLKKQSEVLSFF